MKSEIKILRAVSQHANFINNIERVLQSGIRDDFPCPNHTECQFGSWYYGEGAECMVEELNVEVRKLWDEIGQLHEQFHKEFCGAVKGGNQTTEGLKISNILIQKLMLLDEKLKSLPDTASAPSPVGFPDCQKTACC